MIDNNLYIYTRFKCQPTAILDFHTQYFGVFFDAMLFYIFHAILQFLNYDWKITVEERVLENGHLL